MFNNAEELGPPGGFSSRAGNVGKMLPPVEYVYNSAYAKLPAREKNFMDAVNRVNRMWEGRNVKVGGVRPRYAAATMGVQHELNGVGLGRVSQEQRLEAQRRELAARLERERMMHEARMERQRQQMELKRQRQQMELARKKEEHDIRLTKWREAQEARAREREATRQFKLEKYKIGQESRVARVRAPYEAQVSIEKMKNELQMKQATDIRDVTMANVDFERAKFEHEYKAQLAIAEQMKSPMPQLSQDFYEPERPVSGGAVERRAERRVEMMPYQIPDSGSEEELLPVERREFGVPESYMQPLGPEPEFEGENMEW